MKIGFIGQGFVGKSYADDFERRGYSVVRYSLEPEYAANREGIASCDVVSISVPTPTTPNGQDLSILESVIPLVADGKTALIRSTVLPGSTEALQAKFPNVIVLHAPEFLLESGAQHDAARPAMNIVGFTLNSAVHREKAAEVLAILPVARFSLMMTSREAEMMKYIHNVHGVYRIVFTNVVYELAQKLECDWGRIQAAMEADPMLSPYYNAPMHKGGRGAGGHCFIKDFAAFRKMYGSIMDDPKNLAILTSIEEKNLALLRESNKSQDLVKGVYGTTDVKL